MQLEATEVGLLQIKNYECQQVKKAINELCIATGLQVNPGSKVLLKPNLVSGRGKEHLACTHPMFIRAVAEWFVDCGVVVSIGDSPALGSALGVMQATGITEALQGLPVKLINFDRSQKLKLAGGVTVDIASQALECDPWV
jgi:uncharacterized protein (DUF362 family)